MRERSGKTEGRLENEKDVNGGKRQEEREGEHKRKKEIRSNG